MTKVHSSEVTKKLLLFYIQENIEYRKRSMYLQEIIAMSRTNDLWRRMLLASFHSPMYYPSYKTFSKN